MTVPLTPHNGFRMPTLIGILLVIVLVGVVIAVFEWYSRMPTAASGTTVPTNVAVTNIADTGFTVVWITPNPATGAITLLSPKHTPSTFFDNRDTTGTMKRYTTHSVTLRSLAPATSYMFQILSNGKSSIDGSKPYTATTVSPIGGTGTGLEPAYGTINDVGGSPVNGAIVLVTLEQGQLLSTITSPSGSWLLSLGFVRTASLAKYLDGSQRLTEMIRVLWGDQEATAVTDTLNDAPVPTMVLGKTYDFRRQQATNGQSQPLADATRNTPTVLGVKTIGLTAPAQNASLTTTLPLIVGTGLRGKTVSVVVGITNPVSGTTTVGGDGIWRYTPTKPLGEGKQSVTATTVDERGLPVAFTHTFTIFKSGTQVLGEATPSAQLTPTFTPTPTATAQATPTPTPEATLAGKPVPTSGTTLPTILILLLGTSVLGFGLLSLKKG